MFLLENTPKIVLKKDRIVGRGEGSGLGKNCGKGHKGQTKRGGKRPVYFTGNKGDSGNSALGRTPKYKGFKALENKQRATLLLGVVMNAFNEGETVSILSLRQKNLIGEKIKEVKIINSLTEDEKPKKIKFDENEQIRFSNSIREVLGSK
jgi:large subunit ribosomal protein L15